MLTYFIAIHCLMMVTLMSLLGICYQLLIVLCLLLVSFIYYCRKYQWLQSDKSIIRIERDANQQWYLIQKNELKSSAYLLTSSFVISSLVILHFEGHQSVTIFADAVEPDLLRQLRVYCRRPSTFSRE